MNTSQPTKRSILLGAALVAGLAIFVCVSILWAVRAPGVDNDLTQVLTVARNIANGNGVVTETLYYTEHYVTGQMPAPQTVFPPGQPAVVGSLMFMGLGEMHAAWIVSGIGFVVIPICLFFLCMRAEISVEASLGAAILWLCVVLAWANTVGRKSDVPFAALTMVSACFLVRSDRKQIRDAFIAGVFAAIALSFRYAGLFFMTAVGLTLVVEWLRNRTRHRFLTLIAFCVPAGAVAGAFFYRNYSIVGDIKGGNNYAVNKPIIEIARSMYRAISSLTGLDYARLLTGGVAEWLLVLTAIVGTWLLIRGRNMQAIRTVCASVVGNRSLLLCCIYPILTLVMLYVLETKSQPGSRDRMYMAAFPFVFCLIAGLSRWQPQVTLGGSHRLKQACVLGFLLTFLLGQTNVAQERFAQVLHEHHWHRMNSMLQMPMAGTTVQEFFEERITKEHPLLGNEPQRLGELLKRPVLGLPSRLYTVSSWTADEVKELVDQYDVQWVLAFTDATSLELEDIQFFHELAAGDIPPWLVPELDNGVVRVFRVKQPASP